MLDEKSDKRKLGYARVSTVDQKLDLQIDALTAAGCVCIYKDHGVSGGLANRPGLDKALKQLQAGDMLVVYKLDRLGRSVVHLADLIASFKQQNIAFCSLTEGINTETSGGKLIYHVFSAVAEFQRDLIRENTIRGIKAAKARGKIIGRPSKFDPDKILKARQMIKDGNSLSAASREVNVPKTTLKRHLDKSEEEAYE